jgi:hypothetical protein
VQEYCEADLEKAEQAYHMVKAPKVCLYKQDCTNSILRCTDECK